jgi:hypothetical protein
MTQPITDAESLSEEPQSFKPVESEVSATIVHHNGSTVVEGFESIKETDAASARVVVQYEDGKQVFYGATVTSVDP